MSRFLSLKSRKSLEKGSICLDDLDKYLDKDKSRLKNLDQEKKKYSLNRREILDQEKKLVSTVETTRAKEIIFYFI